MALTVMLLKYLVVSSEEYIKPFLAVWTQIWLDMGMINAVFIRCYVYNFVSSEYDADTLA